jgi:protein SCO1/2
MRRACSRAVEYSVAMGSGGAPSGDTQAPATLGPALRLALPIVVILVIVGGVTLALTGGSSKPALPGNASPAQTSAFQGSTLSPAVPAPPLSSLRNYDGTSFNLAADRGKAVFVTFLYTHCPDVCPLTAEEFRQAQQKLSDSERDRTAFVAISVDPLQDTPAAVQAFAKDHGLATGFLYLIGSTAQLQAVWSAYGIRIETDPSTTSVGHSDAIYLLDRKGQARLLVHSNITATDLANDVKVLAAER